MIMIPKKSKRRDSEKGNKNLNFLKKIVLFTSQFRPTSKFFVFKSLKFLRKRKRGDWKKKREMDKEKRKN
jgi:hypothetical protein